MAVSVRVPASTANLGPGYDAFGLALALHNVFLATPAEEWSVEVHGHGEGVLSTGADNRVAEAMAAGFAVCGQAGRAARIVCENGIPAGSGLGSSAAAIVGGVMLADAMCDSALGRDGVLRLAAEIEGHPDNVAAAVLGGFAIAWSEGGEPRAAAVQPARGLAAIVVGAAWSLSTSDARGLLPATVPHTDAARSVGRAGLVAAGVALGREDLLAAGLSDCLHEPYRAGAIPDLGAVTGALRDAGAVGAVLSGAGPTVVGLVVDDDDEAAFARAQEVAARAGVALAGVEGRLRPLALRLDRVGARVEAA